MDEIIVSVPGLTKLDQLEIAGTPGVRFEEIEVPEGAHGEPTLLMAYFAMSALTTLAAYLLRKYNNESFEETVSIVHPDGTREERRVKWNRNSAAPPEADIIRQIRGPL